MTYDLEMAHATIRADRILNGGRLTDIRAVAIGLVGEVELLREQARRRVDGRNERVDTVSQLVHQYRHRAGTSATCGECRAVAEALARVLLGDAP